MGPVERQKILGSIYFFKAVKSQKNETLRLISFCKFLLDDGHIVIHTSLGSQPNDGLNDDDSFEVSSFDLLLNHA